MTDGYSLSDIAMASGNNNDCFGGNGSWWIIVLFLFAFCGGWGGNAGGYGLQGAANNYVLASDFATIQRQLSDGFNSIDNALDRQNAGICDLGYTQAQLINGVQINQMQNSNALMSKIADVNYNLATQSCGIGNAINTAARDIIDNNNAGIRALHDEIVANRIEDKNAQIQAQQAQITALQLAASQEAQTNSIVNQLKPPCPSPAWIVPNPNAVYNTCGCGYNYGCS